MMWNVIAKAVLSRMVLLPVALAVSAGEMNEPSENEVRAVCQAVANDKAKYINIPYNTKTQLDINNDGNAELILVITEGSGGYERIFYFSADGKEIKPTRAYDIGAGSCCIRNIEVIKFAERIWIVKGEKNHPEQTLFIAADNSEHLACEFADQTIKPHFIPNDFSVKPNFQ